MTYDKWKTTNPADETLGPERDKMMERTERQISQREREITQAARALIGIVRVAEQSEHSRSQKAELELNIELTGGGNETWVITIERTASSH